MDVSADLTELGRTPVAVVCAGVKSVLDIPRTLEYLETQARLHEAQLLTKKLLTCKQQLVSDVCKQLVVTRSMDAHARQGRNPSRAFLTYQECTHSEEIDAIVNVRRMCS